MKDKKKIPFQKSTVRYLSDVCYLLWLTVSCNKKTQIPNFQEHDGPSLSYSSQRDSRLSTKTHGGCPMSGPKVAKFLDR